MRKLFGRLPTRTKIRSAPSPFGLGRRTRLPVNLAPNIRVIFDKNREPVAKNVRKACGTVTLRISDYFNIREEQGAWLPVSPTSKLANCERPAPTKMVGIQFVEISRI